MTVYVDCQSYLNVEIQKTGTRGEREKDRETGKHTGRMPNKHN